jgi:deoxyribodipyrimidine photolyase
VRHALTRLTAGHSAPPALPRPSALPLLALVDADPESNPANWQWVAGSGADAAPYFRVKGAGVELGTTYPGPIIDRRGARERALKACAKVRAM